MVEAHHSFRMVISIGKCGINGESSGEVWVLDVETLSSGNYDSVIAKWKTLDQIELPRGPPAWSLLAVLVFATGGLYFPIFLNGTLFRGLEAH